MNSNTVPGGTRTLENEYTDILNIGKIFHVEDKAQALVDEMKAQVSNTLSAVQGQSPVTVAVVEPISGSITNYGAKSLAGDMVTALGGELAMPEADSISKEDLVAADPEVIFVVYMAYSGDDPESVMAEQLSLIQDDPALQSLQAVKNRQGPSHHAGGHVRQRPPHSGRPEDPGSWHVPGAEPVSRRGRASLALVILAAALVLSLGLAVSVGSMAIPMGDVYRVMAYELFGLGDSSTWGSGGVHDVVWLIRLPRLVLAAATGAGLGLCGAVMQAMVQNTMADPYILGVSSGAYLGAALALTAGAGTALGGNAMGLFGAVGALSGRCGGTPAVPAGRALHANKPAAVRRSSQRGVLRPG